MTQLVLSLFPGMGLLDMAFEEAGFCVVRGPDLLWGGDVHSFHPPVGRFDGVIGGPPCQAFSQLRHMVLHNGHTLAPNLIPQFERIVSESRPSWFLMENVPDAPMPSVERYAVTEQIVRDVWCGGETNRQRRFSFGRNTILVEHYSRFQIETVALHTPTPLPAVVCDAREVPVQIGGNGYRKATASGGRTSSLNRGGPMPHDKGRALSVEEMAVRQGLCPTFVERIQDHGAFTAQAIKKGIGNGVPLAMGRSVAAAVNRAIGLDQVRAA